MRPQEKRWEDHIASTNKLSTDELAAKAGSGKTGSGKTESNKVSDKKPLPGASGGPDDFVESYLLYLLAAASDKASAQFHAKVRDRGLRVPEWRVLATLIDREGAMITRLADIALIEQSRLTRIIDQMDNRGLVRRKSDSTDRRRVRVFLTVKGRRLAQSLINDARIHEQGLLASLADSNVEQLKPLLSALLLKLQESDSSL